MEEEKVTIPEVQVVKVVEDTDSNAVPTKVINGELKQVEQTGKKEEEEHVLDGEFIKVEKESFDVKDGSHTTETAGEESKPSSIDRSSGNSSASREVLEAQEKLKELELELERVAGALKQSESESTHLKEEVLLAKEKLEKSGKKYEELDISHKKLQEEIIQAEERYNQELHILREALKAQEKRHKELLIVKEAFDNLNSELESSNKKMQELEEELKSTSGEARKFEELHKQSGSHAESETKKALEFERLLELAKSRAKEVEDQMASLQEELKSLYDKIAENQKVEEALKNTTADLSKVQEELELSKSQVVETEQRLSSKEALIIQLTQELDQRKASEAQIKEDISVLESLVSSIKEDLQAKVSELEEIKLKLQVEVSAKQEVEAERRNLEAEALKSKEELAKVIGEKEALESTVDDLNSSAAQMKELCSDLEEKLHVSDENFLKADALLSQALANGAELEQKLKALEELHHESGYAVTTTTKKNLELEEMLQASNAAAAEAKSQLTELETRFIASEQRKIELEQQLNILELGSNQAERELREFSEKLSELNATLKELQQEKKLIVTRMLDYEDRITQLESDLSKASAHNSELKMELKSAVEKCAEHEGRANENHQRSLELEDLMKISHSKAEESGTRVSEFELLLEAEKYRIQELEMQIVNLENKCRDADAESKKHFDKIAELEAELETFKLKASSFEAALHMANEKEKELTECLNVTTEEKKILEDVSKQSGERLVEAENLLEVLRNELNATQQRLESIESDFNAAGLRETEIMDKLKFTEEQLEQKGKVLEKATARSSELEALHENLSRDSELKLQEAVANFTSRDSEAKSLSDKLKALEDQVKIYQEQIAVTSEKSASMKEELEQNLLKLASLDNTNEELKTKILEAEDKAAQVFSENELLVETNLQLKNKVNEIQESLNSSNAEKEATALVLASHMNTITELTEQRSRDFEFKSSTEACISEKEAQLKDAVQKLVERDVEATDLKEKLNALEDDIKLYEARAHESSALAETQKVELEQTLLKLKDRESIIVDFQSKSTHFEKESEGLTEANLKLTQELATYETKLNDLQTKHSATSAEKDEAFELLNSSKKEIQDLKQQLASEGQSLQSEITSLMEENKLLNETYQNAKVELQTAIIQFEGQLKERTSNETALKTELETLKGEVNDQAVLQSRLHELEEKLAKAKAQVKEEVESVQVAAAQREAELSYKLKDHVNHVRDRDLLSEQVQQLQRDLQLAETTIAEKREADSKKELEREAALKKSSDELEAKNGELLQLANQVKELEQKLQLAEAKTLKDTGGSSTGIKTEIEMKSRDIGSTISIPSKRKSKKKVEASSAQISSPSEPHTATEVSSAATFKFVLGVALVSVIIGIILGKRY